MAEIDNKLICIIGPTAVGKTNASLALAHHFNAEIFSSDSRQIYTEMTIGTAKISAKEMDGIPHHFIDTNSIFNPYSAGDYERECIAALGQYFTNHNIAILCGGTGLYTDAVVFGLDVFPDISTETKKKVADIFESQGIEGIKEILSNKDPAYFAKVDNANARRMIRALEVILESNNSYSSFLNQDKPKRTFTPIFIQLEMDRDVLYQRINKRVDMMIKEGLEAEAKHLYPHKSLKALQTVGYREFFQYFDGIYDNDFTISEIKKNSRRYAKRQITWNKKYNARAFRPEDTNQMIEYIQSIITA